MKSFASSIVTGHRGNYTALPIGLCKPMTGDPRAVTVDVDWFTYAVDLGVRGRASVRNVAAADRTLRQTAVSTGTAVAILPIGAIVEFTSSAPTNGYLSAIYSPSVGTVLTGFVLASALNIEREPRSALFNAGVSIDLGAGVGRQMGDIVGVYIDNADVATPVYLRCDDTGQIITCSDYKSGYFALLSNEQRFTIFADDIVPPYTAKSVTRIVFTNAPLPNFAEEQFNEVLPLNRVSGLAQYRSAALADKSALTFRPYSAGTAPVETIIVPARVNSFVILSAFELSNYPNLNTGQASYTVSLELIHEGNIISRLQAGGQFSQDSKDRNFISGLNVLLNGSSPLIMKQVITGNGSVAQYVTGQISVFYTQVDTPLLT